MTRAARRQPAFSSQPRLRLLLRGRRATERGASTIFVIGMVAVLFAVAGLAIDGGRVLNGKDRAYDVAEQAARAGANQLDIAAVRSAGGGQVRIDETAARNAAAAFVASVPGYSVEGIATSPTQVTVRVRGTVNSVLLSLAGFSTFTVRGDATASPVTGITSGAIP
jgi:Flp pilus assembly protein TadG